MASLIRARFEQLVQRSPMPRAVERRQAYTPAIRGPQHLPAGTPPDTRSQGTGRLLLDAVRQTLGSISGPGKL